MKEYKLKKYCQYKDCFIICSYNFPEFDNKLYCHKHKLNGMILKRSNTCLKCNKYPTFNYINNHTGIYCKDHKLNNMISVINICLHDNCNKQAQYNFKEFIYIKDYKTKKLLYCKDHKLDNMVNIKILKYKN